MLKVASGPDVSPRSVFPMVGSDGSSSNPSAPPQGLRFRIKPSVDLDSLGLPRQALVIARALQQYGFYIGDSGGVTALKLEDTRLEGRGRAVGPYSRRVLRTAADPGVLGRAPGRIPAPPDEARCEPPRMRSVSGRMTR